MHPEMNPSGPTEFEEGVVYVDDDLSVRRCRRLSVQAIRRALTSRGDSTIVEWRLEPGAGLTSGSKCQA
jgi:hypothetical protein